MDYKMLSNYDDILTADEVRQILKIGKNYCYELLKSNTIPSLKIGNCYRIPKSNLINYIQNI